MAEQETQGVQDEYYGYYNLIRNKTVESEEISIYDYRIDDHTNHNNFSNLVTFNLAIIMAKNLNISYFRGYSYDKKEVKYFKLDLVNLDNRFQLVKPEDYPTVDQSPYITIIKDNSNLTYNDILSSTTKKPFIRIFNYNEIPNNLKIFLDFVDSGNGKKGFQNLNSIKVVQSKTNSVSSDIPILQTKLCVNFRNNIGLSHSYYYKQKQIFGRDTYYETLMEKLNINDDYIYFILATRVDKYFIFLNEQIVIPLDEGQFKSLLFSCLPTPLITDDEIAEGEKLLRANDSLYEDINGQWALAIDPSEESKDKDDGIFFEEDENTYTMNVYISDVSPFMNPKNIYIFNYAIYKQETEYITDNLKYPLLDPYLSEKSLSLMSQSNKAIQVQIIYKKENNGVDKIPVSVSVKRVKNLKIIHTTYSNIHNNFIDENPSTTLLFGTYPSKAVLPNNFTVKEKNDEQFTGFHNLEENMWNQLYDQIKLLHKCYKEIGLSIDTMDKVSTYLAGFEIKINKDSTVKMENIYEKWIHTLIEITALEVNKYVGIIEYVYCDDIETQQFEGNCFEYIIFKDKIEDVIKSYRYDETSKEFKGFYRGTSIPQDITIIYPIDINDQNKYLKDYISNSYKETPYGMLTNNFQFSVTANYATIPTFHFQINSIFYTHFTSPLRRFCDLVVHNYLFIPQDAETIRNLKDSYISTFTRKIKNNNKLIKDFDANSNLERYLNNLQCRQKSDLVLYYNYLVYIYKKLTPRHKNIYCCQFLFLNTNITFDLNDFNPFIGYAGFIPPDGFYYITEICFIKATNLIKFSLIPFQLYDRVNYDNLILYNILDFFSVFNLKGNKSNYLKSIINFTLTSHVKFFIDYYEKPIISPINKQNIEIKYKDKIVYNGEHTDSFTDLPTKLFVYDIDSNSYIYHENRNTFNIWKSHFKSTTNYILKEYHDDYTVVGTMTNTSLYNYFPGADFQSTGFQSTNFQSTNYQNSDFQSINYQNSDFQSSDFQSTNYQSSDSQSSDNDENILLYIDDFRGRNLYVKAFNSDGYENKSKQINFIKYTNMTCIEDAETLIFTKTENTEFVYVSFDYTTKKSVKRDYCIKEVIDGNIIFTDPKDEKLTYWLNEKTKKLVVTKKDDLDTKENNIIDVIENIIYDQENKLLRSNMPQIIKYLNFNRPSSETNSKYFRYKSNYQTKYLKYKKKYLKFKEKLSKKLSK